MRPTGSTASSNTLTPSVTGIPIKCSYPDGSHAVMGAYSRQKSPIKEQWTRTDVRCPLCRAQWLKQCVNAQQIGWRRVVRACDGGPLCNGLAQLLPLTHDALNCPRCNVSFTRLRESPPAIAAVDPQASDPGKPTTREEKRN